MGTNENKSKKLTPEDLKKYEGHENLTDEEAIRLHEDLTQLAAILIRIYPIDKILNEDSSVEE